MSDELTRVKAFLATRVIRNDRAPDAHNSWNKTNLMLLPPKIELTDFEKRVSNKEITFLGNLQHYKPGKDHACQPSQRLKAESPIKLQDGEQQPSIELSKNLPAEVSMLSQQNLLPNKLKAELSSPPQMLEVTSKTEREMMAAASFLEKDSALSLR